MVIACTATSVYNRMYLQYQFNQMANNITITEWLSGAGTYADGMALYAQSKSAKATLITTLSKGDNPKNREKLRYELKKLVIQTTYIPVVTTINITDKNEDTALAPDKKQALMFHNLPPELRPVYKKAMELFRENCLLKVQLNELAPGKKNDALAIQIQIFDNHHENRLCWQKIDYWLTYRKLPPIAITLTDGLTPAQLIKRQQNLFSSISRLKKRMSEANKEVKTETNLRVKNRLERAAARQQANIMRKEEELNVLTRLINAKDEG